MDERPALPLWPHGTPGGQLSETDIEPCITPVLADSPTPTSAIVVCPGGGYTTRAPHEHAPVARWLSSLGISAFVVDYRVSPNRYPAALQDACRGIRMVRYNAAEWNVDPERVGIIGFSAGGHLAANVSTAPLDARPESTDPVERINARPDATILCYPVISFAEWGHTGCMANLLGQAPDPDLRASLCLERRVDEFTPPCFIWHTADDAVVPLRHSLELARALEDNDVPFELHVFPQGTHGLGLAQADTHVGQWTRLAARWLASIGFCKEGC